VRVDQNPSSEAFESAVEQERDDLPVEAVEAAKKRSRINALILGAVFLLLMFAPHPWNAYAPILFLIPVVYSLISRIRGASNAPGPLPRPSVPPQKSDSRRSEPYSYKPRDPKDPRKYKPIG
jgi:hypothetical protein